MSDIFDHSCDAIDRVYNGECEEDSPSSDNEKNILVKYSSKGLLPEEIKNALEDAERRILESHLEHDKIIIYMSRLKGDMIRWFAHHTKLEGEDE